MLLLAWTIGFIIYFRKRSNRRKQKNAAIAAGLPPPELKTRPGIERVVIPPDPVTFFNQRRPEYETAPAAGKDSFGKEIRVGHVRRNDDPTGPGEKSGIREGAEDEKPILSTLPDLPNISPPKRYRTRGKQ